jgi:uncharacterized integral membrane protein (TIGR00697 family)
MFTNKKTTVYVILAGLFITNAVVAELIGGKLIQIGPFIMSIGIIPWPVVFLTTDLINEFYGVSGVKKLSLITAILIGYAFVIVFVTIQIPAAKGISPVSFEQFKAVFGQSLWIIVGSITAFIVGQLVDVALFSKLRKMTGEKYIWLRSTGSTVISQLVDTFLVVGIAFWLPGKMTTSVYLTTSFTEYTFKLVVAILLTPFIYLGHSLIKKRIGEQTIQE